MKLAWLVGLTTTLAWTTGATAQEQTRPAAASRLPAGVRAIRDLEYVEGGHERNRLDLYLPEKAEGLLPVVVWIHGGAWHAGKKDPCPAVPLVTKGYAVASINYRFSQHAPFPAQIVDCKAAIRWLRAHAQDYRLDPARMGVWGASAGGHLVALLGTTDGMKDWEKEGGNLDQSNRVQCVIDWYGRTDMTMASSQNNRSVTEAVSQLLGCPVDDNRDKAIQASPLHYVNRSAAPFLIMHGDQDPRVPLKQSELLADALKKAGADVTLHVVAGAGHGGSAFSTPENWTRIEAFLAQHLGKAN
jgi:acetyl esterase/lipase